MDNSLIQELENEKVQPEVPLCAANLSSPMHHNTNLIGQLHCKIGTRLYIENAD